MAAVKKLGIFAILRKFIKPIIASVAAAFAVFRQRFVVLFWRGDSRPEIHRRQASDVELEVHDVAVMNDIFLAFLTQLAGFLGPVLPAE